ncbi:MAG: BatA domain-containing protein [Planctomycetales bacterium]|nr:BatA domain-containing protein [Planctomycetales bacterium]
MGLLAPLYALAAIAIVGPIVFHLIRRQPTGQTEFSSLMFLRPSPPRLTRRSRLENLLLLFLRALALGIIALAFARPYWRQESFLTTTLEGRVVSVLLDTSASMQRPDVWQSSLNEIRELLDSLSANDRIAFYTIDEQLETVVGIDSDASLEPLASQQAVRSSLNDLAPTWRRTELARGLMDVADLLNAAQLTGSIGASVPREIVLITDLHSECGVEALQGFPWPEGIALDVRQVQASLPGNARLSLMSAPLFPDEDQVSQDEDVVRVRIENNADSPSQNLELIWSTASQQLTSLQTTVQVPAGQVRVIPSPRRPQGATELSLRGDSWEGDNTLFVAKLEPVRERILVSMPVIKEDEDNIGYFLSKAPLDTSLRRREIQFLPSNQLSAELSSGDVMAVVIEPTAEHFQQAENLRTFADTGGIVIIVLAHAPEQPQELAQFVSKIYAEPECTIHEASVGQFSLLGRVNYQNELFAPFADPRFNDFSKIRFWNYRHLEWEAGDTKIEVVAELDDGSPFICMQRTGKGRIWLLAAGWQPTGSNLALSSKFLPLIFGMLDPDMGELDSRTAIEVGDPLPMGITSEAEIFDSENKQIGQDVLARSPLDNDGVRNGADIRLYRPGLYRIVDQGHEWQVAVQVPASEGRLTPLDPAVFESYGISLGKSASHAERAELARQLKVEELENKQRLWQWLLLLCLVVLGMETYLAGRAAHLLPVTG